MALSDHEIQQFLDLGYHFPVPILKPGEVDDFRSRLEAFEAGQDGTLTQPQRNKCHLLFKWIDDLIRDARILDPIEQLIGPDILCWNTIFWVKEAASESFVSWHQDKRYWGLDTDKVVTAWLALSDASLKSGCLKVMPGTHTGDVLKHEDRYHQDNMLTRGQEISDGIDEAKAVFMPLAAGQMSFHNYRLAHASGPNTSQDRRIGISLHFMPPETRQIVGDWDSAALVRGKDSYGHFEQTPVPSCDFDGAAVAFHAKAAEALRQVLYTGARQNTEKL